MHKVWYSPDKLCLFHQECNKWVICVSDRYFDHVAVRILMFILSEILLERIRSIPVLETRGRAG